MERHNSKASVGSLTSSRAGNRREKPTHMIVQRENDNQMVMLPIANLVNGASARVKLNDKATFKPDINCRKQERGVIVLFGEWLFPF